MNYSKTPNTAPLLSVLKASVKPRPNNAFGGQGDFQTMVDPSIHGVKITVTAEEAKVRDDFLAQNRGVLGAVTGTWTPYPEVNSPRVCVAILQSLLLNKELDQEAKTKALMVARNLLAPIYPEYRLTPGQLAAHKIYEGTMSVKEWKKLDPSLQTALTQEAIEFRDGQLDTRFVPLIDQVPLPSELEARVRDTQAYHLMQGRKSKTRNTTGLDI